jgi:hypothetical protein
MMPDFQAQERSARFWETMRKIERRRERRLALHWPIRLSSDTIGSFEATTENLSAGGFYFSWGNPLAAGERLDCEVTVSGGGKHPGDRVGSIYCQAEVVRVEALGASPGFGVGCKILDFTFVKNPG